VEKGTTLKEGRKARNIVVDSIARECFRVFVLNLSHTIFLSKQFPTFSHVPTHKQPAFPPKPSLLHLDVFAI